MKENNLTIKITSIFLAGILIIGFIRSGAFITFGRMSKLLCQKITADAPEENPITIDTIESDFSSNLWIQHDLIDFNGAIAKMLNMQGFYSDMGMYITDDNYIISASASTSTDYEYQETVAFRDFLEANGINFLYVNEPTKYTDDSLFADEFGVETYSNRNMDVFLSRIKEENVDYIDLRENIAEDKMKCFDLFYRTDHHWTVPAGLWATQIMAEGLNQYCGYNINTSIYDIDNYETNEWKNCWLGEQGKKVAKTYVGLDDYTEVKPRFETSFTFKNKDGSTWQGTFDDFINESLYNTENDVYENKSWHYSYKRINCINNNVDHGKILLLCDSYDYVTQPFLALGVHEVDSLMLRSYDNSFSLRDYILKNGYDTVIVAYAQFMVGAHDKENSANYRMFTFEY